MRHWIVQWHNGRTIEDIDVYAHSKSDLSAAVVFWIRVERKKKIQDLCKAMFLKEDIIHLLEVPE
jgi:hypothetical protein